MNTQQFISYIEHPELLGKKDIGVLKNIVSDFPYFQVAQVLLTKALFNEKHYEFEKQLARAAVMVPDRAVLFRFVHQLQEATQSLPPQPAEELAIASVVSEVIEEEPIIEAPIQELQPEAIAHAEPLVENNQLEEPIVVAQEIQEENTVSPIDIIEEPPIAEHTAPVVTEVKPVEDNTHSFLEWLSLQTKQKDSNPKIEVSAPTEEEKNSAPKAEKTIDETAALKELLNRETTEIQASLRAEIAQQVERSNVNEFESILDKFIRENPRITRAKAEFYNPVNMAKQSVEEDEELVTETLANVYYKQGNYKKAIRAYEKLCLIYPHKMTYFAGLIQKIKTENKD